MYKMTSQYCARIQQHITRVYKIRKQTASTVCISYGNLLNVPMALYLHSVTRNVKQGSITLQANIFHGKLLTRGLTQSLVRTPFFSICGNKYTRLEVLMILVIILPNLLRNPFELRFFLQLRFSFSIFSGIDLCAEKRTREH